MHILVPSEHLPMLARAGLTDVGFHGYVLRPADGTSRLLRRAGFRSDRRHFDHRWRFAPDLPFGEIRSLWLAPEAQFGPREATELLARLPALQSVYWQRAGLDTLPVEEFAARGIRITTSRGLTTAWVAESILACILADAKMLTLFSSGRVPPLSHFTRPLSSLRVAILGTGLIGRETARLCHALGMRVIGLARRTDESEAHTAPFADVRPSTSLAVTASEADYLVLALPLTPETHGIVDATVLAALGPHGALVNLARPNLVNQRAMFRALTRGALGAAYVSRLEGPSPWVVFKSWRTPNLFLTHNREAHVREKVERAAEQFLAMLHAEGAQIVRHR